MAQCCSNSSNKSGTQNCPQCGQVCKSVAIRTLYHQVRFPENQAIAPNDYYFCLTKECSIGYFSATGNSIPKQVLRSYQDITDDKICYCFDISTKQYRSALSDNTAETLKNFIIQKTKSGECACEIRNPSGQCCLAKFKLSSNPSVAMPFLPVSAG